MRFFNVIILAALLQSCAHIVPPEGGPKDVLPPQSVKSSPPDRSIRIFPGKIILTFNENIQLTDAYKNLTITPDLNSVPQLKVFKNKLTVFLDKDSLKPNTSYTLNFGKAISDLNEGNVLDGFIYTFCTGSILDTLALSGTVQEIKSNVPVVGGKVYLTRNETNVRYTQYTNDKGAWTINHLAPGAYQLLIFKDKNLNQKPDQGEAYFTLPITLKDSSQQINGKLIPYNRSDTGNLQVVKVSYVNDYTVSVVFNQSVYKPSRVRYSLLESYQKKESDLISTEAADSFLILHPFSQYDTLILNIQTDTLQKLIVKQPAKRKKAALKIAAPEGLIRKDEPFYLKSSIPLRSIDASKILLTSGQTLQNIEKADAYRLKLSGNFNKPFDIIFLKGALTDIDGIVHPGDTLKNIRTAEPEQTGNLEFTILDTALNYTGPVLVELFNDQHNYRLSTLLGKSNSLNGLLPGTYHIQAWEDTNNNGLWDSGDYNKNMFPEKIRLIKEAIRIKANWDTMGVNIYMD